MSHPFIPRTIAIVGLGLLGGSLAAACRRKFPRSRILGISRSIPARKTALRRKWVHRATQDLRQGVAEADFVVICTPVDTLKKMLLEIDNSAPRGGIVTDVGSVKGEILRWAGKKKFKNIQWVSAHPMAGSHVRGIQAACRELYEDSLVFIVRSPAASKKSFARVKSFWRSIGGRVVETTPDKHDLIVSEISHLPHALAVCLMLCVSPESLPFAAKGFRDTTRIAQGHPSLWGPIFFANRKKVYASLTCFEKTIQQFKKALRGKEDTLLLRMLHKAAKRRGEISL